MRQVTKDRIVRELKDLESTASGINRWQEPDDRLVQEVRSILENVEEIERIVEYSDAGASDPEEFRQSFELDPQEAFERLDGKLRGTGVTIIKTEELARIMGEKVD